MRLLKPSERVSTPGDKGRNRERSGPLARLRGRRSEARIALILLGLIILPSGLLGFLSWRAIQNERTYSQERIRESYRRFARLAGREIDLELRDVEARWTSALEEAVGSSPSGPAPERLAQLDGKEPLISSYFMLTSPGTVAYPPAAPPREIPASGNREKRAQLEERETFDRLATRGEELEYQERDLSRAISTYREILSQVSEPQLSATVASYIGRAQLKNSDWAGALETFRGLLARYPEVRDLNRMYLRFLAQYQIAVALDGMGKEQEAVDALLALNEDLLRRSNSINTLQYSYYLDLIQDLAPRLLRTQDLTDRERYEQAFRALKEQNKKRISQKYFLQLLDADLNKVVVRRWERKVALRERETFDRLVTRGEELEYHDRDLNSAMGAYRDILSQVSDPQLRAMAASYIGRAQIKNGDWAGALETFRTLLTRYPEVRDLNRMYLRFLAQYQIAVALDGMGREQEAIDALLALNEDLLRRSDAINTLQYSYYLDLIQDLAPRLLSAPELKDQARYEQAFRALKEQNKKRISQKYYVQLLDARLNEMVVRRRHYSPRVHYLLDRAEGEPFLLVYRALPDAGHVYVTGLLAAQIDLAQLRDRLFPTILRNLQSGDEAGLAILSSEGGFVIGTDQPHGTPIAMQSLGAPFDFWQVAVYLHDVPGALRRLDLRTTLWLWLVSLLLLSILFGAYVFVRRARREAYLSRAQTTFVSNVTHELRTPLTSIRMFAELLEMQMASPDKVPPATLRKNAVEHLGIIRRESERLTRLIENVLDFSKMEHHTKRYQLEYHDIAEILRQTIDSFRPHAESNGFSLELEAEEPLPELLLDADAISQVILNLLSNAVQYSDDVKQILVRAHRDGDAVTIAVADRGIGIAADELTKVFDKFYSGRQRMDSRQSSGLGLGLTLARSIARAHGGDIQVRSELGEGSTFTVTLPIPRADEVVVGQAGDLRESSA